MFFCCGTFSPRHMSLGCYCSTALAGSGYLIFPISPYLLQLPQPLLQPMLGFRIQGLGLRAKALGFRFISSSQTSVFLIPYDPEAFKINQNFKKKRCESYIRTPALMLKNNNTLPLIILTPLTMKLTRTSTAIRVTNGTNKSNTI